MPQTMGRKRRRPRLPTHPDRSAELAVPEPPFEPGDALGLRPVRESEGRPLRFAVFHAGEKRRGIGLNTGELFAGALDPALVRRPPALQRRDITRQMFGTGTDELHTKVSNETQYPRPWRRTSSARPPSLELEQTRWTPARQARRWRRSKARR